MFESEFRKTYMKSVTIIRLKNCSVRSGVELKISMEEMKRFISKEGEMIKIEKLKGQTNITTTAK